ncbi:P-loop containing nucleoside triphosphate hydrolase protein [Trametes maxima]|nr:P-loop containing nucleoside triphosphate hydrolase protein [Trametes maxima]
MDPLDDNTCESAALPPLAHASIAQPAVDNAAEAAFIQREEHSRRLLQVARNEAVKEHNYDSVMTRSRLREAVSQSCAGKLPYEWQLDVAEALVLGLDTVLTAGTGAGKTMPFVMPLLLNKADKKMVIIISPLNELERDQARRFQEMGLAATAVNGEDYNMALHGDIQRGSFQVLVTSPEMCLEHEHFSQFMHSPEFMRNVLYVVVDEAHCISQWGDKFRKLYGQLAKMRSYLGVRKPFLLASATFPPFVLHDVSLQLEFRESTTFYVNLGNNRPNITPIVHFLKAAKSSLPILDFLVSNARPNTLLPRAIIFFNTRDLAFKAHRYLKDCVCKELTSQIDFLHAGRGQRSRKRTMRHFRTGQVRILCATEAAGMGMDIADVEYAMQFLIASSLSIWTQRSGRAGRSGAQSYGILFVEPSVFERKGAPQPHTGRAGRRLKPKSVAKANNLEHETGPTVARGEKRKTPFSKDVTTVTVKREVMTELDASATEAAALLGSCAEVRKSGDAEKRNSGGKSGRN